LKEKMVSKYINTMSHITKNPNATRHWAQIHPKPCEVCGAIMMCGKLQLLSKKYCGGPCGTLAYKIKHQHEKTIHN
jgi:hypothetical protein